MLGIYLKYSNGSKLKEGVSGVVIIDGRKPHAVLYELFSEAAPKH